MNTQHTRACMACTAITRKYCRQMCKTIEDKRMHFSAQTRSITMLQHGHHQAQGPAHQDTSTHADKLNNNLIIVTPSLYSQGHRPHIG